MDDAARPAREVEAGRPMWRFEWIEASAGDEETVLRHLVGGAQLSVRGGRLRRGHGYAGAPPDHRRSLARVGAILRLRERGYYHVHAAGAVDDQGRAWLLTGASGSGKSTLAYALARAGWTILGDDAVIVDLRGDRPVAHGWRDPLQVSTALVTHFQELAAIEARPHPDDPRLRVPVWPRQARAAPVGAVVFVERGDEDRLAPLAPHLALTGLIGQSPWVFLPDAQAAAQLAALRQLVVSVPTFHLRHTPRQLHEIADTLRGALP